jgi:hypothetical protein
VESERVIIWRECGRHNESQIHGVRVVAWCLGTAVSPVELDRLGGFRACTGAYPGLTITTSFVLNGFQEWSEPSE